MADYELSPDAVEDLSAIAAFTIAKWSAWQSSRYEAALRKTFQSLASGRVRTCQLILHRPEIVACRCEHHVVFAVRRKGVPTLILAVLHESMDLVTRLRARIDG